METSEMKKCPFCAEMIKAEALKCRYCKSNLVKSEISDDQYSEHWKRVKKGKKIAGVCTGIARELNSPQLLIPIRVFFVLTTLLWGFGLLFYIVMWIIMPSYSEEEILLSDSKMKNNENVKPKNSETVEKGISPIISE